MRDYQAEYEDAKRRAIQRLKAEMTFLWALLLGAGIATLILILILISAS